MSIDDVDDDRKIELLAQYIARVSDLRQLLPQALAYSRAGYSASYIARELDASEDTVQN